MLGILGFGVRMPSFDIDEIVTPNQGLRLVKPKPVVPPGIVWPPMGIKDWCDSVQDVPEYLLKDLLPADCNILMSGKAKRAFKSWMVIAMAYSLSSGKKIGPFEPVNTEGIKVGYLGAEGGRAQSKNRYEWLSAGLKVPLEDINSTFLFAHRQPILFDSPSNLAFVLEWVQTNNIQFLIVDPLTMHMKGDENKVSDMSEVMRSFTALRQNGCSVMFVHHLRKSFSGRDSSVESDPDEDIRGSSAISGYYDQHWAIRTRNEGSFHKSRVNDLLVRSKDDEERRFEVEWFISKEARSASFRMDPVTEETALAKQQGEIEIFLQIADEPVSRKRIEEMLGMDDVAFTLRSMVEQGRVKMEGRGYVLANKAKSV